jgi:hypothetical protein
MKNESLEKKLNSVPSMIDRMLFDKRFLKKNYLVGRDDHHDEETTMWDLTKSPRIIGYIGRCSVITVADSSEIYFFKSMAFSHNWKS